MKLEEIPNEILYFVMNGKLYEFAGRNVYDRTTILIPIGHDGDVHHMDIDYVMPRLISASEAQIKYPEFLL